MYNFRFTLATLCFLTFITLSDYGKSQVDIDSLRNVWNDESNPDEDRLKAMHIIAWNGYLFTQPDSAFFYAKQEYDFAKSKDLKIKMSDALNTMAISYAIRGNHPKAIEYYEECMEIRKEADRKDLLGGVLTNLGLSHRELGNYAKAIECQISSLKLQEEFKDTLGMAHTNNNISVLYQEQGEFELALKYSKQSLVQYKLMDYMEGINTAYVTIGQNYKSIGDDENALKYLNLALNYCKTYDFQRGLVVVYLGLADLTADSQPSEKLEYLTKALEIARKNQEWTMASKALTSMSGIQLDNGEKTLALKYARESYDIAKSKGSLTDVQKSSAVLAEVLEELGIYGEALEVYQVHIDARDSLRSEQNQKEVLRQSYKYQYEKQAVADSIKAAEAAKLKDAEIAKEKAESKQQRQQKYALFGGLAIVLLFLGFVYNRFKVTKKQKGIIEEQKEEVDQAYVSLNVEKEKSEELLLNILPEEVAEELKEKGAADAKLIDHVTVLFTDFKGFTALSELLTAKELVHEINRCFSAFDQIMGKYNVEKIKTIGDAYMAAGGLPLPNETHAKDVVRAAMEIQKYMLDLAEAKKQKGQPFFEIRIGVHTGPVVAGIVGVKKFQYDIWGDTVNTASRMESSGSVGKVNISEATYLLLKDEPEFTFESRGAIEAKGKGKLEMFFVEHA